MHVTTRALLGAAVAANLLVAQPSFAHSGGGCVSEGEYLQVRQGMTRPEVTDIFHAHAVDGDGGAGGYALVYPRCHSERGTVVVEYVTQNPGHQRVRVYSKRWRAPGPGDVQVIEGNAMRNSFDLVNRRVRKNHLYARGGADYVFMQANGLRDVINCGSGKDLVHYLDYREPHDVYRHCEQVIPYSP